ncbi:glycoside hydrolase family 19 protein [Sphingomonas sp. PB4P5]|uniref:glycoside hydrolase family 19 protein n=1 Tax=Parasphingomonas puruogangriensis TaxID=3096155 RepID=UPI002FCC7D60
MTSEQSKRLQANLGVAADGLPGANTFRALFQRLGASVGNAGDLGIGAATHFPAYGILDNPLRAIHFLGQCGIESDYFKAMEEYASGAAYEGRADLGNTQPGDGKLFKGRGMIQVTGRANYRKIGQQLGINLERYPQLLSNPSLGLLASLQWWKNNGMNAWADRDDAVAVSRGVNRGNPKSDKPANHEAERIAFTNKVRGLFA